MFQTLNLKNQFGEESHNFVIGGSSQINCNFIVDAANGNGLGLRSLKGSGVSKVFMHTSATPASGSPNPLPGFILVQLASPYAAYEGGSVGFVSPVSGSPLNISSGVTKGQAYVIVSVGTTTQTQWQAIGLPVGIVPAVGVSFVASVTGNGVGTGVVEVPATAGSGIFSLEVVGNANLSSNPTDGSGAWLLLQLLAPTSSSVTTLIPTAPADGTVIGLTFKMDPVAQPLI
jgi:hypothetical protein